MLGKTKREFKTPANTIVVMGDATKVKEEENEIVEEDVEAAGEDIVEGEKV